MRPTDSVIISPVRSSTPQLPGAQPPFPQTCSGLLMFLGKDDAQQELIRGILTEYLQIDEGRAPGPVGSRREVSE